MKRIIWIGLLWMAAGLWLSYKGMRLMQQAIAHPDQAACIHLLSGWGGFEAGLLALISISLILGLIKGRFVLRRVAAKLITQWELGPRPFYRMLAQRTLPLMALMVGLGISLHLLGLPSDLHGAIDLAIGSALAQGGVAFVRLLAEKQVASSQRG